VPDPEALRLRELTFTEFCEVLEGGGGGARARAPGGGVTARVGSLHLKHERGQPRPETFGSRKNPYFASKKLRPVSFNPFRGFRVKF
jgi:hypothetical protein